MTLIGYTFAYGRKEIAQESEAYLNHMVDVYKTLKGCVNAIKQYLEDEDLLSKITWRKDMDKFIKENEGNVWSEGIEVGWIGKQFYDNRGFFIKCVYLRDDPGEVSDEDDGQT